MKWITDWNPKISEGRTAGMNKLWKTEERYCLEKPESVWTKQTLMIGHWGYLGETTRMIQMRFLSPQCFKKLHTRCTKCFYETLQDEQKPLCEPHFWRIRGVLIVRSELLIGRIKLLFCGLRTHTRRTRLVSAQLLLCCQSVMEMRRETTALVPCFASGNAVVSNLAVKQNERILRPRLEWYRPSIVQLAAA